MHIFVNYLNINDENIKQNITIFLRRVCFFIIFNNNNIWTGIKAPTIVVLLFFTTINNNNNKCFIPVFHFIPRLFYFFFLFETNY